MAVKNIENIKIAKALIKNYIDKGHTDNMLIARKVKSARTGLTGREVSELVNKYTEEYLLSEGWLS